MSKFVAAIRRTLVGRYQEPSVHFHQGLSDEYPEVCHEDTCARPRLAL
jgi:hypothetical protein